MYSVQNVKFRPQRYKEILIKQKNITFFYKKNKYAQNFKKCAKKMHTFKKNV